MDLFQQIQIRIFLNADYITGNYIVRRNLDRLRAMEKNKASLLRSWYTILFFLNSETYLVTGAT